MEEEEEEEVANAALALFTIGESILGAPDLNLPEIDYDIPKTTQDLKKKGVLELDDSSAYPISKFEQFNLISGDSCHTLCLNCKDYVPTRDTIQNHKCSHWFCIPCILQYLGEKIQESAMRFKCPKQNCNEVLEPEILGLLPEEVLVRLASVLGESSVLANPKYIVCPFGDCGKSFVDDQRDFKIRACTHCWRILCMACGVAWHMGKTCFQFELESRAVLQNQRYHCPLSGCGQTFMELDEQITFKIKTCTRCWRNFCVDCRVLWHTGRNCSQFRLESGLVLGNQSYIVCPFGDCGKSIVDYNIELKIRTCIHCLRNFCVDCRVDWHLGISCAQFQLESPALENSKYIVCPFEDCGKILVNHQRYKIRVCTYCYRFFCVDCKVAWHMEKTCARFQSESGAVVANPRNIVCPSSVCGKSFVDAKRGFKYTVCTHCWRTVCVDCTSLWHPGKSCNEFQHDLWEVLRNPRSNFVCPFGDCGKSFVNDQDFLSKFMTCTHCQRTFCFDCKAVDHLGKSCGLFLLESVAGEIKDWLESVTPEIGDRVVKRRRYWRNGD